MLPKHTCLRVLGAGGYDGIAAASVAWQAPLGGETPSPPKELLKTLHKRQLETACMHRAVTPPSKR